MNLWTLWWNADRFSEMGEGYWDAPIFHPEPAVFVRSEPQPLTGLLAWPLWRVVPAPVCVINAVLLVSLAANGWFALRWLRRLRLAPLACWTGAILVTTLPFTHWQSYVLQCAALWPVLWLWHALDRIYRRPSWRQTGEAGAAGAAVYLTCSNYGILLAVCLLPIGLWMVLRARARKRRLAVLIGAFALAMAAAAPVWLMQLRTLPREAPWDADQVRHLSAEPAEFFAVRGWAFGSTAGLLPLSAGWVTTGLALFAVIACRSSRRLRRPVAWLAIFAATSALLAMSPRLEWQALRPYEWLTAVIPGLAMIRNVFRAAVFTQLALTLLAAIGVHLGLRRFRGHLPLVLALVLCLLAALETWPLSMPGYRVPDDRDPPGWVSYLVENGSSDEPVLLLPYPPGRSAEDYLLTAEVMYWQPMFRQPLLNGYTGVFPDSYRELRHTIRSSEPVEVGQALRDRRVVWIVTASETAAERVSGWSDWRSLHHDRDAGVRVWSRASP